MTTPRTHILFSFVEGPWGGGNQFLKALRGYLNSHDAYAAQPEEADVLLLNGFERLEEAVNWRRRRSDLVFVHRVDGPTFLVRGSGLHLDRALYRVNRHVADGTVFQSNWSRRENYRLGMRQAGLEAVITNACDPAIFNRDGRAPWNPRGKVRLIATSWSANWRKGFAAYQWLDERLDFERYEMVFVGRSPVEFRNIRHVPPQTSEDLAGWLKRSDIYITASQNEPCSNSLVEALHCGLPAVGLREGGHPEIIGRGGETFAAVEEIPGLLEKIVEGYGRRQAAIQAPSMEEVGRQYHDFMVRVRREVESRGPGRRRLGLVRYLEVKAPLLGLRVRRRAAGLLARMKPESRR